MEGKINKDNLKRVVETYKYMFWHTTGLKNNEIDIDIDPNLSNNEDEVLEVILLFSVDIMAGPGLQDIQSTLTKLENKIHSFVSKYQISARGKISHSPNNSFKYNGCMVSSISYDLMNEQLIMLLEYHYETEEHISK